MVNRTGAYRILVSKPKGRSPLGSLWHRREDDIKIGLREVGWRGMDRTGTGGWLV
jgi:hypothetical protein